MRKLFENKTTYTEDTYIEFLKFHSKTYNLSYISYTLAWSAFLLLSIYLSFSSKLITQGILLLLALIGFVFYRLYHPKMIVHKELSGEKISTNNTNTFSFFDNYFIIDNNNGSFSYRYFLLHKVFETADYFYLYMTKENAFLLSKNSFSLGTSEEFSKFIRRKCILKYSKKIES